MRYSFCILTNDNLTDGEKETLKYIKHVYLKGK